MNAHVTDIWQGEQKSILRRRHMRQIGDEPPVEREAANVKDIVKCSLQRGITGIIKVLCGRPLI